MQFIIAAVVARIVEFYITVSKYRLFLLRRGRVLCYNNNSRLIYV